MAVTISVLVLLPVAVLILGGYSHHAERSGEGKSKHPNEVFHPLLHTQIPHSKFDGWRRLQI
jgi:hypothetical protein